MVYGAPYRDASRAFLDLMIPHHEMAAMMSEYAARATGRDDVRQFARRMTEERRRQSMELRAARRQLFGSDSTRRLIPMMPRMMGMHRDTAAMRALLDSMRRMEANHAGHGDSTMMHHMMGMMTPGRLDRIFLEHMIFHDESGNDVSLLAERSDAATRVKQLARELRTSHERDVVAMRRLLAALRQ